MYRFLVACTTCINKQDSFLWEKNCFRVLTIFKFFLETSLFIVLFIVAHLIWEKNVHIFSLCINERVSFSKYVHAKPLLSHAYFQNLFLDYLRDITCKYNYWSIWENQNVLGIQVLFFSWELGLHTSKKREAFYENSGSSFPINVRICVISSKFVGREAMPTLKKQPPSKRNKN